MLQSNRIPMMVASTTTVVLFVFISALTHQHHCIPLLNSTGQQLAQIFMPENISLNLEQMSRTAMNPMWLNNQSMVDLIAHVSSIRLVCFLFYQHSMFFLRLPTL